MLIVNHQTANIPAYVLRAYSNFITDHELITLLNFQCTVNVGKAAWEEVATNMGYASIAPVKTTLTKLAERGIITINRYVVDATPLWDSCLNSVPQTDTSTIAPKTKKASISQPVYAEIITKITPNAEAQWHSHIKRLLKKMSGEDIIGFVNYVYGYKTAQANKRRQEFTDPVTIYDLQKWERQWIEKGKPDTYQGLPVTTTKDFSTL